MNKLTAKTEIIMGVNDKLFDYCPHCGAELEHLWQHIREDDANPVRMCQKCDTAWIWQIYN